MSPPLSHDRAHPPLRLHALVVGHSRRMPLWQALVALAALVHYLKWVGRLPYRLLLIVEGW